jgi:predicted O-methyltransferase YrrM
MPVFMNRIRPIAHRVRRRTTRQNIAFVASALLGVAIVASAATGWQSLATALIGLTAMLALLASIQLRRGLAQNGHNLNVRMNDLAKRFDVAQRRILASVENERLMGADRQSALEGGQRRLIAALENERLAAAERQRQLENGQRTLLSRLSETQDSVEHVINTSALKSVESIVAKQRSLGRNLTKTQRDQTAETEALLQLFREFEPRAPMPSSGRMAMNPTGLLEMLFLIARRQPRVVLELGSGTSSVWIAYALEKDGGRLISVEHDTEFAERTKSLLHLHEVSHLAEVRLAELRQLNINGEEFEWYDVDAFQDLNDIDLLLVDGPPGSLGETARYPALHVLESRLAPNAVVILDDADRPGEQGIARRWITDVAGLRREREIFSRQAVLTYCRP